MPSTVVDEFAKPICALPSSTPRTLAMPAPGCCWICNPGIAASHKFFSAPPSGIHDPPCGPVIMVTCWAVAGTASAAAKTTTLKRPIRLAFIAPPAGFASADAGACSYWVWTIVSRARMAVKGSVQRSPGWARGAVYSEPREGLIPGWILLMRDVRQCAVCECLPPGSETCDTARPTVVGCSVRARSANETMPTSRLSRLTTGSRRTWTWPMFRATSSSA